MKIVFITGGTGYIGVRLIRLLLKRGGHVIAFVRPGSEYKVPAGAAISTGNPFDSERIFKALPPGAIFVQLLGVPHPSPGKKDQFYQIDLPSVKASADAAAKAGVNRFVYVSVAQEPTTVMRDYQAVRAEGERYIENLGLPHTFIRPWYVTGPGHWWPLLLWPLFKLLEWNPRTRSKVKALGLVHIDQMLDTLLTVIEQPETTKTILDVAAIRQPELRQV